MLETSILMRIVEGALLAADEPLSLARIEGLFADGELGDAPREVLRGVLKTLQNASDRGVEVTQVASGYRMQVAADVTPWVGRLQEEKPRRYSRALLETLAIIAWRQPVTRGDVEEIRGVAVSSNILRTLTEREWVRIVGHRDVPGKPAMYATTREFLDYFGLKSLDELPALAEIRDPDEIGRELELDLGDGTRSEGNETLAAQDAAMALVGQLGSDEELPDPDDDDLDGSQAAVAETDVDPHTDVDGSAVQAQDRDEAVDGESAETAIEATETAGGDAEGLASQGLDDAMAPAGELDGADHREGAESDPEAASAAIDEPQAELEPEPPETAQGSDQPAGTLSGGLTGGSDELEEKPGD